MIIYLLYIFIAFKLFIYFLFKINQNGTKIYYCKNYYYRRFNMENIINNKNKMALRQLQLTEGKISSLKDEDHDEIIRIITTDYNQ